MSGSGRWLTVEERDNRVIVSAKINPRDLADGDLPDVAEEITAEMGRLPAGQPVVLAGDWPLWAIACAARLAHPRAAWIGVQERDGTVIVVAAGQEGGRPVPLASVNVGAYVGDGPCDLTFQQTRTRGVYQLQVTHPTPARPIGGHTTVDLNSVRTAIEELQPPSDLAGVLITGYAWRVVIAMLANLTALRPAQWCAVDEPRRGYAVMSWGTYKAGTLFPRDGLPEPPEETKRGSLPRRLWQKWIGLPIRERVLIVVALIGLCGTIYATTIPLLFNRPPPTPTATVMPTVTPMMTATPMPTATSTLTITVTSP